MSDQQVLTGAGAAQQVTAFERWSVERIRYGLASADGAERIAALSMSTDPARPNDPIVAELTRAAGLSRDDLPALILAATALGMMQSDAAKDSAANALGLLAAPVMPPEVRGLAVNGLWAFGRIPEAAWPNVAAMLFDEKANLRAVACAAALPLAPHGAAAIVAETARVGVGRWTAEGLDVLAASAGTSAPRRSQVEDYVLRGLADAKEMPKVVSLTIAAYACLARMNPAGAGVTGLIGVAQSTAPSEQRIEAISAIGRLGESAKQAITGLVQALEQSDDPAIEEAICHALMPLGIAEHEVPLKRTLERVETGPEQAVVAHCMLLALHAKPFAKAAPIIARKIEAASDALKPMLDAVYEMMTGRKYLAAASAPAQ